MPDRTGEPGNEQSLRERVDRELAVFLATVGEVDIATIYRTMVDVMGVEAMPHIAAVIGSGLRRGTLALEPRVVARDAPAVPFVRLVMAAPRAGVAA